MTFRVIVLCIYGAIRWRLSFVKSVAYRCFPFIRWLLAPVSYKKISISERLARRDEFSHRCVSHIMMAKCTYAIAVFAHLYHDDLAHEFLWYFKSIQIPFDLYISTHADAVGGLQNLFAFQLPRARVFVRAVENRGRDMAPFCVTFRDDYPRYDLVCWVHSKKSAHDRHYLLWRRYLLRNLLGSRRIVENILCDFQNDHRLGVVYPEIFPFVRNWVNWDDNFSKVDTLLRRMGIAITRNTEILFPAGAMFWFRPQALTPIFDLNLSMADFEVGSEKMLDGTLAHALERIILLAAEKAGYSWKKVLFSS